MMKSLQSLLLILLSFSVYSQEYVYLKQGESVILDGIISSYEWSDADSIEIEAPDSEPIKVYFKYDEDSNFLAAFVLNNIAVNQYKIPEILFDTYNDKSISWQNDDWWFHISAQDCEANGIYDVYNDCSIVQSDWYGVPNFGFGYAPPIDFIELQIPFDKLDIAIGDTIGFAFNFWISDDLRLYWPESALIGDPSTWANVIIHDPSIGICNNNIVSNLEINISPNPFNQSTTIKYENPQADMVTLSIRNLFGKEVKTLICDFQNPGKYSVVWDGTSNSDSMVPDGLYYCIFQIGNRLQSKKILFLK